MAKVSLRIYNREIEGMVDSGQLDEAIAHCRHILNAFPKNLETYRLLGKAYLESKRYGEATDIFERVLMAVPDDFVSHVGMSIINDEQKDMDAAIWHMERAFEVQPSNTAIQAELQRLYGRRDGVEPPKIRLTRGALAHMYVQGELYAQAISEIKSVLEDDPNRQDMQVLLARAHFHAGQQSEAAEMCSQLLRRYPYCLDANRVLIELLPQSERGESTQVYRHRLSELDPYSTFATGSVFHTEEVADAAVNLERLDWDGQPVDIQPGWSDSLGITKGDSPAAPGSAEPDWLKSGLTEDASSLTGEPAPVSGGLPIPTADDGIEEDIPDFLREAGWGQSTGAFQEGPGTFDASDDGADDGSAAEALAAGDLPDWVKAMAPEGADSESSMPQAAAANLADDLMGDDVPDWLQGIGDEQDETPAKEPAVPDSAGELPDWLDEMKPEGEPAPASQAQPAETPAGGEDGLPDWLDEMKSADVPTSEPQLQETVEPADEDGMPDWLDEMKSVDMPESEPQTDAEPAADGELPDWLEEMREESPAQEQEEPVESVSSDFGASAQEQDDAVAWLESLASKHGAKDEELVTDPSTRKETAPEWIQKAQQEAEQEQAVTEPEPEMLTMQEESPEMEESVAEEEEPVTSKGSLGTSAQEQDDAVAWLESLASKHGAKAEELVTDPSVRKDTAPEWVQKALQEAEQEQAESELVHQVDESAPAMEEPAPAEEEEPEWMKHAKEVGESLFSELEDAQTKEPIPSEDIDETGMWLQDLEKEPEPEATESTADEDISEWLAGLDDSESEPEAVPETEAVSEPVSEAEPVVSTPVEEPVQETGTGDDLPSWLGGLEEEKQAEPVSDSGEDLPDWSSEEAEPEPTVLEPTTPEDWKPADAVAPEPEPEPELKQKTVPQPPAEPERVAYREPVTRSRSGMTGMLSAAQDPLLVQAQNELIRSNIPAAMENYTKLIKKGKMLDEVIFDLREALYRFPVEVSILQTLGDAYMRANRIQDALDAYTKAEELLR